jgi:hypothetical protein
VCTREYATAPARKRSGSASGGRSWPTDAANANPDAECPDGNDRDDGILTWRSRGTPAPSRSGRCLAYSDLTPRFTVAEVTAIVSRPRAAARRPACPPKTAIAAATPSHRRDLSAAWESRRIGTSRSGVGVAAIAV